MVYLSVILVSGNFMQVICFIFIIIDVLFSGFNLTKAIYNLEWALNADHIEAAAQLSLIYDMENTVYYDPEKADVYMELYYLDHLNKEGDSKCFS